MIKSLHFAASARVIISSNASQLIKLVDQRDETPPLRRAVKVGMIGQS